MQFAKILEILTWAVPALISLFSFSGGSGKGKGKKPSKFLTIVMSIAAYFILKKWAVEAAKDTADGGIQTNPDAAAASLYMAAMNPSGIRAMIGVDGTDEESIMKLAALRTYTYQGAFNKYKSAYNRNLTEDLQSELSATDYNTFLTRLNQK